MRRKGIIGRYYRADSVVSFSVVKITYSERDLPMTEEAYQCFKRLISKRRKVKVGSMVDGVGGFQVLGQNGMPYLENHWEKRFQYALGKYNRTFKEELPTITPHVCRYTYCSNMAKSDYYIPDLKLPEENRPTGCYGQWQRDYLKEEHPARYNPLGLTRKL